MSVPAFAGADHGLGLAARLLGDFGFDARAVIDGSHR
jgi:hypothetical protein